MNKHRATCELGGLVCHMLIIVHLPKKGLISTPVYVSRPFTTYRSTVTETWTNIISAIGLFKHLSRLSLPEHVHTKINKTHLGVTIINTALNN